MAQPQNLRSLTAAIRPNVRIILCPGHWMEGAGSMMAIDEESQNAGYFIGKSMKIRSIDGWETGVAPIPETSKCYENAIIHWNKNVPENIPWFFFWKLLSCFDGNHMVEWWNQGMAESSLLRGSLHFFWHCLVFLGPQNWHIYGITREFLVTAGYSRLMNPRIVSKNPPIPSLFSNAEIFLRRSISSQSPRNLGLKSTFPWIFPTFSEIFFVPSPAVHKFLRCFHANLSSTPYLVV